VGWKTRKWTAHRLPGLLEYAQRPGLRGLTRPGPAELPGPGASHQTPLFPASSPPAAAPPQPRPSRPPREPEIEKHRARVSSPTRKWGSGAGPAAAGRAVTDGSGGNCSRVTLLSPYPKTTQHWSRSGHRTWMVCLPEQRPRGGGFRVVHGVPSLLKEVKQGDLGWTITSRRRRDTRRILDGRSNRGPVFIVGDLPSKNPEAGTQASAWFRPRRGARPRR
jgi:hypothetical protein